jgi:uncharacterized membrane protein
MFQLPDQFYKRVALLSLSVFFIFAGVNHFLNPDFYIAIMPPYLPFHRELNIVCGFFEILGGIMVLTSRFRVKAGMGLVVLLLAVFPANIHMALHPELFQDLNTNALYVRLPFQIIFIIWAYWATHDSK